MWDLYDQARVLRRAAEIVERGIAKGAYETNGYRCIISAVRYALSCNSLVRDQVTPKDFRDFLVELAVWICPEKYEMLVDFGAPYPARDALIWWNDKPSTTGEEAHGKLMGLAQVLKERYESEEAPVNLGIHPTQG